MDNPLLIEWSESRKTIARFDGYLLKLRILALSIFTVLLVAAVGISKTDPSISFEITFIALALLFFYICVIFILDRYYERMLIIAVTRASRLEAARLKNFKIGLTTEIEIGKNGRNGNNLSERIAFYLTSAGKMIVFIYTFVFAIILISLAVLIFKTTNCSLLSKSFYLGILFFLTVLSFF